MATSSLTVESPLGPLLLVARDRTLTELSMSPLPRRDDPSPQAPDRAVLDETAAQLDRYFAGSLTAFDLPLDLRGTPFQQRVWSALQEIPFGETISYGELAASLGKPGSARAVGLANGQNPISIIVPCHRVIGSNGKLTGYGGGLDRKAWLLDHEAQNGPGQLALEPAALVAAG